MNIIEYNKVKELNYHEFVLYLNNKHGAVKYDFMQNHGIKTLIVQELRMVYLFIMCLRFAL